MESHVTLEKTTPPFVSGKILLSKQNWEWIFTTLQKKKKTEWNYTLKILHFLGFKFLGENQLQH